jgi:hypothetical protein
MNLKPLASLFLECNRVYEESFVVTTGQTEGFYSMSMFDAVYQVVGEEDTETFEFVYAILASSAKDSIITWSHQVAD